MRGVVAAAVLLGAALPGAARLGAQDSATVRVTVRHGGAPLAGAAVRTLDARPLGALSDARGVAVVRLPAGPRTLLVQAAGMTADTLRLALRAGQDTALAVALEDAGGPALEAVVVTATRGERRVEDTPLRVEVIDEEEIAEKVAMTPGDVAMMLNETSGLRVQTTNPALGAAGVRIQGLRGRYALVLVDGLPLHGQAGGLGLLQIPPLDLGRVEVIKGAASALYGSTALGGVVNLVSRRPGAAAERTLLVNQTSRGGTDGVFFGGGPLAPGWGWTLLAGAHRQGRQDVDADGWSDLAGYRRGVARPRLFWDDGRGRSAFVTAGLTAEAREGGGAVPGGRHDEALRTRRGDVGGLARWVLPDSAAHALRGAIVTVRGSGQTQRHAHRFGDARERDRHRTWFGEAAVALPRARATWVGGAALQRETYRARDVAGVGYAYTVPAAFAQVDVDPRPWLALSASARVDAHSDYGTFASPRVSALLRAPAGAPLAGWTARLSAGTGASAPTPFVDETEATGLRVLAPLRGLSAERARAASLDVGGAVPTALGRLEVNATAFASRVAGALQARDIGPLGPLGGVGRLALASARTPTRTGGADVFGRLRIDDVLAGELGLVATYVHLRSTEQDPDGAGRREVPLTPRHSAGLDVVWEREGRGRAGLELYYTGRQALDDDPYLARSRPYLLVGLLGEWRVDALGGARVFVNGENLGGVRQSRYAPLVRPSRGPGGRWTTDAWTELAGATVNAGVRLGF